MTSPAPAPAPRDNDTGYNNPTRPSPSSRPLGAEERAAFAEAGEGLDPLDARTDVPPVDAIGMVGKARRWARGGLGLAALLVVFAALLVYLVALDVYLRLDSLPPFLQVPFWILLGLFAILLVGVAVRGVRLWWRLRPLPQTALPKPLAELGAPEDGAAVRAREALAPYVGALVTDAPRLEGEWTRLWRPASEQRPADVLAAARTLADPGPMEAARWLEDFERGVVRPLDAAANERIWHYTRIIAVKTAISPFPLIDALAVLYNSGRMLHDLALLYNRRLPRAQAGWLLAVVIFQTYVASQAQEVLESGAEELSNFVSHSLARVSGKVVGARLAEGTVNGLVARRLGRRALRYLRPVR